MIVDITNKYNSVDFVSFSVCFFVTRLPLQLIRVVEVEEGYDRRQYQRKNGEHRAAERARQQSDQQVASLGSAQRPQPPALHLRQSHLSQHKKQNIDIYSTVVDTTVPW